MVISLKEYDKLHIRNTRDSECGQISKSDAVLLQSLISEDFPLFKLGNRCLIAQHWVGVIDLPGVSIEILPKIAGYHTPQELRAIIVRMLLVSQMDTAFKSISGSVSPTKNSISEVLIDAFLRQLNHYLQYGLISVYEKVERNQDTVKGRILFQKQFQQNILNPVRFYCRYSTLIQDNGINQFFKVCLTQMQTASRNRENLTLIAHSLEFFRDISDISVEQALSYPISFNSINAIVSGPYQYGLLFLKNYNTSLSAGNILVNAWLYDMNLLFERFIYRTARQAFGNRVAYQNSRFFLLFDSVAQKQYIRLRPDLVLKERDYTIIIDTKWKIPANFSKESDVYQMNAYSTSIPNVKKVFLLYPLTPNAKRLERDYSFLPQTDTVRELGIRTVDLGRCLRWREFITYFKQIFLE